MSRLNLRTMFQDDAATFHVHVCSDSQLYTAMREAENSTDPTVVVRAARAEKSATAAAFFNELAAAWQFPHHFGENWDAVNDCLSEAGRWNADAYVLVVTRAARLFDREKASLRTFGSVIEAVRERVERPNRWRPAKTFRSVLHVSHELEPLLRTRLKSAGITAE